MLLKSDRIKSFDNSLPMEEGNNRNYLWRQKEQFDSRARGGEKSPSLQTKRK